MKPHNVPLAEKRAEVRHLQDVISAHHKGCRDCKPRQPCCRLEGLRADLTRGQQELRTWWDNPGQEALL